jgi:hypothetical protein
MDASKTVVGWLFIVGWLFEESCLGLGTGTMATAAVGVVSALRLVSSGGRTVTATWMARPRWRQSASVIAGRSWDSITSRVNASGTASSAVSSTMASRYVKRR